jgi:hypothetical protein
MPGHLRQREYHQQRAYDAAQGAHAPLMMLEAGPEACAQHATKRCDVGWSTYRAATSPMCSHASTRSWQAMSRLPLSQAA